MEIKCRPISTFPAEFHAGRMASNPFRSGWTATMELLERELEKLGAHSAVIELALTEREIRLDGWPRAEARPSHPGIVISFDSRHGPLRYGTDAFPHWQANVRAIALGLEALRKVDRYGIGKRGEQYQGWRQLTGGAPAMSTRDAEQLLDGYGGEKKALMAAHPDTGGSDEKFAKVQQAREVLGLA